MHLAFDFVSLSLSLTRLAPWHQKPSEALQTDDKERSLLGNFRGWALDTLSFGLGIFFVSGMGVGNVPLSL